VKVTEKRPALSRMIWGIGFSFRTHCFDVENDRHRAAAELFGETDRFSRRI
jgi:hypothetical protein